MEDRNLLTARRIAQKVSDAGGHTFFVGGFVRDRVMKRENKDIDIEIHGITPETLEGILDSIGERTVMVASFGVYGLKHTDLDIAMPRMETATGRGHKDFAVYVDPFLGTLKAARRRDFTMNALMQDVLTDEIVDHFGGIQDIASRTIRHVNDESFAEDPLRVLRAAQFAARFGFSVAPETLAIMRGMDLTALARERIMGEAEKALMKAARPSVFFETLREVGQLGCWFPELAALIDVPQEPRYHPEGSVWNHTMLVLDYAARLRKDAEHPLAFMLSALMHDYGKPACTQTIDGRIRAFDHERAGVSVAETALSRVTSEIQLHKYVQNMVLLHMRPNALFSNGASSKKVMYMLDESICPGDLLRLAEADSCGRAGDWQQKYEPCKAWLQTHFAAFQAILKIPEVRGSDLLAAGMKPSPLMSEALKYAHKLHLKGTPKETALKQTLAYIQQKTSNPN